MGTAIYAQSQAPVRPRHGGAAGQRRGHGRDDEVVEAEIVDDEQAGAEGGAA